MFIQLLQMLLMLIDLRPQILQLLHLLLPHIVILIRLFALAECIPMAHLQSATHPHPSLLTLIT